MSEDLAPYYVPSEQKLPPEMLLKFSEEGFQPPSADDVRMLKRLSGLSGRQLCEIAGVTDPRTFRRRTAPHDAPNSKQIPYAVWRLLLIELGFVSLA